MVTGLLCDHSQHLGGSRYLVSCTNNMPHAPDRSAHLRGVRADPINYFVVLMQLCMAEAAESGRPWHVVFRMLARSHLILGVY